MGAIVATAIGREAPKSLRERAYDSFARHLIASDIRAGQFISQRELVALTGLPITAIRELIPRLEAEGLIRTAPQRGMQVTHVDTNLIRDAFQFRLFLEQGAVALFAREADAAEIARLRSAHDAIVARARREEAKGGPTPELIADAQAVDWDLHASIVDALGNAIVSDAYRVNAIKVRLIRQEQSRLKPQLVMPTMQEHLAVIDAIEARDPARAAEAMATHIASAQDKAIGLRPIR